MKKIIDWIKHYWTDMPTEEQVKNTIAYKFKEALDRDRIEGNNAIMWIDGVWVDVRIGEGKNSVAIGMYTKVEGKKAEILF